MHDLLNQFTLEPLVGTKETSKGPEKVTHQMLQIMDHGVRVGYVGTMPGQPINFLRRYPDEYKHAVQQFVAAQQGATPTRLAEPAADPQKQKKSNK